jgi:hypothetical protein
VSEQEIREGMLLAVWDEPPLDFDPDTLIRRVEQKKSRRRALVAVGVATAMIAVASFSLPGLLPRDGDRQLGAETQTTTSAPPPSESPEKRARSIGVKLAERLRLRMTNLKEVFAEMSVGSFIPTSAPMTTTARNSSDQQMSGYVYLTDAIGPTSLHVMAGKIDFNQTAFCANAVYCKEKEQRDGSTVVEADYLDDGPEISRSEVVRRFPSGYVVRLSSYNYNPSSGGGLRRTVPVQVGVLTELVTDPSISWE